MTNSWWSSYSKLSTLTCSLVLLASCGGSSPTPPGDHGMVDSGTPAADMGSGSTDGAPSGYPAGPYGSAVGDVLPNFTFQGYFSPESTSGLSSSQPFGVVTFDQLRTSGKKYAFIHLEATWCSSCMAAAQTMVAQAAKLISKGGLMMGILVEGTSPSDPTNVATKSDLDRFIGKAMAPYSYSLDSVAPQPQLEKYFKCERDQSLIVDLQTMKIVQMASAAEGGVDKLLPEFEKLLN